MTTGGVIWVAEAEASSCIAGDVNVAGGLVFNADAPMKGEVLGMGCLAHEAHPLRSGVRKGDNAKCAPHAADLAAIRKEWWVGKGCY